MSIEDHQKDYSYHSGERQIAHSVEGIRFDHRARYQLAIDQLQQAYRDCRSLSAIDVFCGNGYGTHMVCEQLGCHCLGVDASTDAINAANEHYDSCKSMFSRKLFPFELAAEKFDFALCFESIEHVEDDRLFLKTVSQAVKPGGYIFLSTPNDEVLSLEKNPHPFHFRHYRPDQVKELCQAYSLDVLESFSQNVYHIDDHGKQGSLLDESMMQLNAGSDGQFQVHVLRKKAASALKTASDSLLKIFSKAG